MLFTVTFFTALPFMALLGLDMTTHTMVSYVFRKPDASCFAYRNNTAI